MSSLDSLKEDLLSLSPPALGTAHHSEHTMDTHKENRIFLRVFLWSVGLSAVLAAGYLVVGEEIIRHAFDGGTFGGLLTPRQIDQRTFEQYASAARPRFWNNAVIGLPLSVLIMFLLMKLYRALLQKVSADRRAIAQVTISNSSGSIWVAVGIYSVCTLIYFAPVLGVFSRHMIGPPEDNMGCYWTLTWAYDHVFHGDLGFGYIRDILYPEGSSFYLHAWSIYHLYLFFALRQLFDAVTCYNVLILHSFVLAGAGAYLLAKYLLRNHWLALLVGFLFAFNPAHLARATHHMNIAAIQFIPLFVLFYIQAIRNESRVALLLSVVFLLFNALVDWNYLIFGCWFMLFSYLYLAIRRKKWWLRDVAWKSAVALGVTVAVLSPLLAPMIRGAFSGRIVGMGGHNAFVVDLSALVVPFSLHLLGDLPIVQYVNSLHTAWFWETTGYLGIVALLVVALRFRQIVASSAKLLLGGLSFLLMSLGAQPHIFGYLIPALAPARIVPLLPVLSNSRAPSRFIVFVYLFWSLIVAVGIGQLWEKWKESPRLRGWAIAGIVALLAIDYFAVIRETTPVELPVCYSAIDRDGAPFGILDLPGGYQQSGRYMMYQSLHGFPIVQGWVSRRTNSTLLDRLELKDLKAQRRQLDTAGVRYIVMHKQFLPDTTVDPSGYRAEYESVYDDSLNTVYKVH